MRCLLGTLVLVLLVGCRTQTTTMTNPFLAPNRVPPPATRALLPGAAQPYYQGGPVPNAPVLGAPTTSFSPGAPPFQQVPQPMPQPALPSTPSTFSSPQPLGTVPPGGWNVAPQSTLQSPLGSSPLDSSSRSPFPSGIRPGGIQQAGYQSPEAQFAPQVVPVGQPRDVRLRAISPNNLPRRAGITSDVLPSRDGFRPQGSSRVRKSTITSWNADGDY